MTVAEGAVAEFAVAEFPAALEFFMPAGAASYALTGQPVAFRASMACQPAAFNLTGGTASIAMPVQPAAFALNGQAVLFRASIALAPGAFLLTGGTANIRQSVDAAAFNLTGNAAGFIWRRNVDPAAFNLTGQLLHFTDLQTAQFVLTGQNVVLRPTIVSGAAAFNLTGQNVTFIHAVNLIASSASFLLSGQDAFFGRKMGADVGAFILSGQPAVLRPSAVAAAASFALTGKPTLFDVFFRLSTGQFFLTGQSIADIVGPSGDHIFLVELQGHDGSTLQTFYLSTSPGFINLPTDTNPNQFWDPRVIDPGNFERHLHAQGQTRGPAQVGTGGVRVVSGDQGNGTTLDSWLTMGFGNRPIIIRSLPVGAASIAAASILFRGKLNRITSTDPLTEFTLEISDQLADLERPLATVRFAGTTTGPGATAEGNSDLAGQIKQLAWGECDNVPLQPANVYDLIYLASYVGPQTSIQSITVFDGGVALTNDGNDANIATLQAAVIVAGHYRTCKAAGLVRLGGIPTFALTADIVEGATSADRTAAQIAKRMLLHYGKVIGDIVTGSVIELDTKNSAVCGFLLKDDQTALDAIQKVLDSIGGHVVPNRDGPYEMGRLENPIPSPLLTFNIEDHVIGESLDHVDSEVPVWRVILQWAPIFLVQGDSELAGVVSAADRARLAVEFRSITVEDAAVKTKHLDARELNVVTYLVDETAATTEANRLLALYKVERTQYQVDFALSDAWTAEPGACVTLSHPTRLGLSAGKDFNVIGRIDKYSQELVGTRLWG